MERKEISFKSGIRRSPSMALESGELSECVNLIPRSGELVNIKPPAAIDGLFETLGELVFVHTVNGKNNYIFRQNATVAGWTVTFRTEGETTTKSLDQSCSGKLLSVTCLGEILGVTTTDGIRYYRWQQNSSTYKALGPLPELRVEFSLTGSIQQQSYSKLLQLADVGSVADVGGYSKFVVNLSRSTRDYQKWVDVCTKDNVPYTFRGGVNYAAKNVSDEGFELRMTGNDTTRKSVQVGELFTFSFRTDTTTKSPIQFLPFSRNKTCKLEIYEYVTDTASSDIKKIIRSDDEGENFTTIMANAESFIHDLYEDRRLFIAPFLVRYGLRMYDGSFVNVSAPVLMIPNKGVAPYILAGDLQDVSGANYKESTATMFAHACSLQMRVVNPSALDDWKDLITSVEVGISKPVWRYNAAEEFSKYKQKIKVYSLTERSLENALSCRDDAWKDTWSWIEENGYNNPTTGMPYLVELPSFSEAYMKSQVSNVSSFFRIKNIRYDSVSDWAGTDMLPIDLSEIDLAHLESSPSLPVPANDYIDLNPEFVTSYNSRFVAAKVDIAYKSCFAAATPRVNTSYRTRAITHISRYGQEVAVDTGWMDYKCSPVWCYYPDVNAKRVTLYMHNSTQKNVYKYETELSSHSLLGGAFSFSPNAYDDLVWEDLVSTYLTDENTRDEAYLLALEEASAQYATQKPLEAHNEMFVSSANNPFSFAISRSSKIGLGEILAISTSAKALSSGTQFGTFPLYAFCSDGIWPLQVSEDGTFDAPQPLSRDVVSNPAGVCQIDQAVVYPTNAGLKVLQAENSGVISEALKGHNVDESYFFSGLSGGFDKLAVKDVKSITDIVNKSKILYDYANSLLRVYPDNPSSITSGGTNYYMHYVFSLQDKEWSTVVDVNSKVRSVVPGYPYGYIHTITGSVMRFTDEEDNATLRKGLILTRPVSFDDPIGMKALCDFQVICGPGGYAEGIVQPFVSNDGKSWYELTSLRSRAFKWFRFRIRTLLTDLDALTGMICDVDPRRQNKLR